MVKLQVIFTFPFAFICCLDFVFTMSTFVLRVAWIKTQWQVKSAEAAQTPPLAPMKVIPQATLGRQTDTQQCQTHHYVHHPERSQEDKGKFQKGSKTVYASM